MKLNSEIEIVNDDCLSALDNLEENSIDTCITDPPYHLTSIVKRFGKKDSAPAKYGMDGVFSRSSAGFMGQEWDGGDIAFRPETWEKVYRALKPGAYLLAFGGDRTYHRLACAVEDAGFIAMGCAVWAHGQGFPKYHDVGRAMSKKGLEESEKWLGWRTSLKPAVELITIAIKPIDKTYVDNALKWGVAGFNIGGAQIETDEEIPINVLENWSGFGQEIRPDYKQEKNNSGRYPANLLLDDSEEIVSLFPEDKQRFFYCAKPSVSEKEEGLINKLPCTICGKMNTQTHIDENGKVKPCKRNNHPTTKPLSLIQHLVTLTATPTGGTVLDPFMGSGTTGCACALEGRGFYGIEIGKNYFEIAGVRIQHYIDKPKQPKLL